jgi:hypothetical protein
VILPDDDVVVVALVRKGDIEEETENFQFINFNSHKIPIFSSNSLCTEELFFLTRKTQGVEIRSENNVKFIQNRRSRFTECSSIHQTLSLFAAS